MPLFLLYSPYSFPLSKLDAIKDQLQLFSEKSGLLQPVDHVQASEDAFWLLEDIQEAILDYQARERFGPLRALLRVISANYSHDEVRS